MSEEPEEIATITHTETWARITVEQGQQPGHVFERVALPAVLGRGKDANVRLVDDAEHPTMSRRHALLAMRGSQLVIQDLSTNGTRVGAMRIVPGETVPLPERTPIWLGAATMLKVELTSSSAAPYTASDGDLPGEEGLLHADTDVLIPSPGMTLSLRTLGSARVTLHGTVVPDSAWQTRKAVVLLVYLALHPGAPQDADHLCERVWPEAEATSRATLQSTVSRIRRALKAAVPESPAPIALIRKGYTLNDSLRVDVDAARFESLCTQAARAGKMERTALLTEAVELYQGPFLEGFTEEWIELHRTRLQHLFLTSLQEVSLKNETGGQVQEAVRYYQRILACDPCWEAAHAGLMRCLLASGRREEAVRQYMECSRLLMKHLNLGPGAEVQKLYDSLTGPDSTAIQ